MARLPREPQVCASLDRRKGLERGAVSWVTLLIVLGLAAGARIWIPVIDLKREDILWERDREAKPPTVHVAFEYPRVIDLPWMDRTLERVFRVDLTMDISRPDWGPPR